MEHAKASKIIRYEELRTAISATTNRKMGSVCGIISTTLYQLEHNELEQQWQKERIPRLGNIVIRMNGKPGEWMCEQITGDRKVAPPWEEYEAKYVNRVFEYAHWDAVLEALVSEADKAMETELVELERADQALKKIDGARGKEQTPIEEYQSRPSMIKASKRRDKAEKALAKARERYCLLVGF